MLTITWDDGVNKPTVFTFSDAIVESLEQYRQTVISMNPITGMAEPIYPSIKDLVVSIMTKNLVTPALNAAPTDEIIAAKKTLKQAQDQLSAVVANTVASAVQG